MLNLTPTQLRQAADLKEKIAGLETQLSGILGSEVKAAPVKVTKKKGGMSAAGRAKIAAAAKLRWAKIRAAKTAPKAAVKVVVAKPAKKGGMSAAGRAKIAVAQKARWAKIKAAKSAANVVPATKPVSAPKTAAKPVKTKRIISPAARAKMAAAAKAMWAAKKK